MTLLSYTVRRCRQRLANILILSALSLSIASKYEKHLLDYRVIRYTLIKYLIIKINIMKNYSTLSTMNFYCFLNNFPTNFIQKVWSGVLANHLESKFKNGNIIRFIAELDMENKEIFIKWIENNYSYSEEFKTVRFNHKIKEVMLDSYEISEELLENDVTEDFIEQLDINVIKVDESSAYFDSHEIEGFEIDKIKLLNEFKDYKRTL